MSMLKQNKKEKWMKLKNKKKIIFSAYKWSESIADEYFCMQTVEMKISTFSSVNK